MLLKHKAACHKAAYHKAAYHKAANHPLLAECMECVGDTSNAIHVPCWLKTGMGYALPSQASQQYSQSKEGEVCLQHMLIIILKFRL